MKASVFAGIILSLACISAAEAPSNYQTNAGIRVDSDPMLLAHFQGAFGRCDAEAAALYQRAYIADEDWYTLALKACLYRYGYFDRGAYAYPANAVFDHFIDR